MRRQRAVALGKGFFSARPADMEHELQVVRGRREDVEALSALSPATQARCVYVVTGPDYDDELEFDFNDPARFAIRQQRRSFVSSPQDL